MYSRDITFYMITLNVSGETLLSVKSLSNYGNPAKIFSRSILATWLAQVYLICLFLVPDYFLCFGYGKRFWGVRLDFTDKGNKG